MDPKRKLRGEMLRELNKMIGKKEFSSLLYMAGECISRITADDLSEEEDLWKFWKEIENAGKLNPEFLTGLVTGLRDGVRDEMLKIIRDYKRKVDELEDAVHSHHQPPTTLGLYSRGDSSSSSSTSGYSTPDDSPLEDSALQCPCGDHSSVKKFTEQGCPKLSIHGVFATLDRRAFKRGEQNFMDSQLRQESNEMMLGFKHLLCDTGNSFSAQGNEKLPLVKQYLKKLPVYSSSDSNIPLLRDRFSDIDGASTYRELFDIIEDYSSFFNFDLPELIVKEFGDMEAKDRLEQYKEKFLHFAKQRVFKLPPDVYAGIPLPEGFLHLIAKVEMSFYSCRVNYLPFLQAQIAKALGINKHALELREVHEGCVELIYSVPNVVEKTLLAKSLSDTQMQALAELNVTSLTCGGYHIMPKGAQPEAPLCVHDELEILRQHYRELLSVLPGQALAPKMLTEGYLSHEDYQSVMSSGTPAQQNLIILSSIQKRPCGWVGRLCALLQDFPGGRFSFLIEKLLQSQEKEITRKTQREPPEVVRSACTGSLEYVTKESEAATRKEIQKTVVKNIPPEPDKNNSLPKQVSDPGISRSSQNTGDIEQPLARKHSASTGFRELLSDVPLLKKMNGEEIEKLELSCSEETHNMIATFRGLLQKTFRSLLQNGVTIEQLQTTLLSLKAFDQPRSTQPYFHEQEAEVRNATSIDELYQLIDSHQSFFNWEILAEVIKIHGTKEDQLNLEIYREGFQRFAKLRLFKCPQKLYGSNGPKRRMTELTVKIEASWENSTIQQVHQLKQTLAEVLQLSPMCLHLCQVKEGCVELVFAVPQFVAQSVLPLTQKQVELLCELEVVELQCGDKYFSMKCAKKDGIGDGDHCDDTETGITNITLSQTNTSGVQSAEAKFTAAGPTAKHPDDEGKESKLEVEEAPDGFEMSWHHQMACYVAMILHRKHYFHGARPSLMLIIYPCQ